MDRCWSFTPKALPGNGMECSSCSNTTPILVSQASVSTSSYLLKSGSARTKVGDIVYSSYWNATLTSLDHSKSLFLKHISQRLCNYTITLNKFTIVALRPKNPINSVPDIGDGQADIALVFLGYADNPLSMIWPRYSNAVLANEHLELFTANRFSLNRSSIALRCVRWVSQVGLYTRASSMNIEIKRHRYGWRTKFITH